MTDLVCKCWDCGRREGHIHLFSRGQVLRVRSICEICYNQVEPLESGQVTKLTIHDLVSRLRRLEARVAALGGDPP